MRKITEHTLALLASVFIFSPALAQETSGVSRTGSRKHKLRRRWRGFQWAKPFAAHSCSYLQ